MAQVAVLGVPSGMTTAMAELSRSSNAVATTGVAKNFTPIQRSHDWRWAS